MTSNLLIRFIPLIILISLLNSAKASELVLKDNPVTNQYPDSLNLKDVLAMALEYDKTLKISEIELNKSIMQLEEIRGTLMPTIESYSNYLYNYSIPKMIVPGEIFGQEGNIPMELGAANDWSLGIKVSQVIYNKSLLTGIELHKELVNRQLLSLAERENEIIFNISRLYHLCLMLEKQIKVTEESINNLERIVHVVSLQVSQSVKTKAELERTEISANKIKIHLLTLNEQHQQQTNLLKILIGYDRDRPILLSQSNHERELTKCKKKTVERILEQEIILGRLNLKQIKEKSFPVINAFGQHYYQGQRENPDFFKGGEKKFYQAGYIGVGIEIPIFSGFQLKRKKQQAKATLSQLKLQKEYKSELLNKEIEDVCRNIQIQNEIIKTKRENLSKSQSVYEKYLAGYHHQIVPLTDLLLANNSVAQEKTELLQEEFKQRVNELNYDKLTN